MRVITLTRARYEARSPCEDEFVMQVVAARDSCGWLVQWSVLSVIEDVEPGECAVHIAVEIGRSAEQWQPDMVASRQLQDCYVGRRRPWRNTLGPYRRNHLAILQQHHRRLARHSTVYNLRYGHHTRPVPSIKSSQVKSSLFFSIAE